MTSPSKPATTPGLVPRCPKCGWYQGSADCKCEPAATVERREGRMPLHGRPLDENGSIAFTPPVAVEQDVVERLRDIATTAHAGAMLGGQAAYESCLNVERKIHLLLESGLLQSRDAVLDATAKTSFNVGWDRAMEEAAVIADSFTCGCCGMDGKAGEAIRALKSKTGDHP